MSARGSMAEICLVPVEFPARQQSDVASFGECRALLPSNMEEGVSHEDHTGHVHPSLYGEYAADGLGTNVSVPGRHGSEYVCEYGSPAGRCRDLGCGRRRRPGWRDLWRRQFHRSEEHTSELQSQFHLVCRLLLEKK